MSWRRNTDENRAELSSAWVGDGCLPRDQLGRELALEWELSAAIGNSALAPPASAFDFDVSPSVRAGTAAVMGVYGPEAHADDELIRRAFADELGHDEIAELESRRPEGQTYRYGPGGLFGWVVDTETEPTHPH